MVCAKGARTIYCNVWRVFAFFIVYYHPIVVSPPSFLKRNYFCAFWNKLYIVVPICTSFHCDTYYSAYFYFIYTTSAPQGTQSRGYSYKTAREYVSCATQSWPPVNWWLDQPLEGAIPGLTLRRVTEFDTAFLSQTAAHARLPFLPSFCYPETDLCIFPADLIRCVIFLMLISYLPCYSLFVSSYCIYIISPTPKIPWITLPFPICMSIQYHEWTVSLR